MEDDMIQLPESLDTVRALFRGEPEYLTPCDDYYTKDQLKKYGQDVLDAALHILKINPNWQAQHLTSMVRRLLEEPKP
jgi:hypothetical protein